MIDVIIIVFLIILSTIIIINYRLCLFEHKRKYKIEKHNIETLNKTDKIIWSY